MAVALPISYMTATKLTQRQTFDSQLLLDECVTRPYAFRTAGDDLLRARKPPDMRVGQLVAPSFVDQRD